MGLQDLNFVVSTHLHHFPSSFFARLGPGFMTRYYRTFLDGPLAAALVAEADGEVCGYLVGVLDGPRHRRLLLRHHGMGLAWAALVGICRRPWLAGVLMWTRLRRYSRAIGRARATGTDGARGAEQWAVLSHVAVAENFRRRGIGTLLIDEFLEQARHGGCTRACLVTHAGSSGASGYYESHDWQRVTREGSSGTTDLAQYERALSPKPPPGSQALQTLGEAPNTAEGVPTAGDSERPADD